MAQTTAERITELRAELTTVKAALTRAITEGQSATVGGASLQRARLDLLVSERNQLERDIQRLENPNGRVIGIDMSAGPYSSAITTGGANG